MCGDPEVTQGEANVVRIAQLGSGNRSVRLRGCRGRRRGFDLLAFGTMWLAAWSIGGGQPTAAVIKMRDSNDKNQTIVYFRTMILHKA